MESFAAAAELNCMLNAMMCCFSKNAIISAAMCLKAANILKPVGYSSNTAFTLYLSKKEDFHC